jgi:hypothetical protein
MEERDIEDVYERIRDQQEKKESDTLTNIPMQTKTCLAFAFGTLFIMVMFKYITVKSGVIIGIVALVMLKVLFGDNLSGRELSEEELAGLLYRKLRNKQIRKLGDYYQIPPHIRVKVEKEGRRVRVNGVPAERIFAVSMYNPRTNETSWHRYTVDLRTGDILHSKRLPAGFIDLEDWDIKIIESEAIKAERRYQRATGVKPKRI